MVWNRCRVENGTVFQLEFNGLQGGRGMRSSASELSEIRPLWIAHAASGATEEGYLV